jgi:hypothetical protein
MFVDLAPFARSAEYASAAELTAYLGEFGSIV